MKYWAGNVRELKIIFENFADVLYRDFSVEILISNAIHSKCIKMHQTRKICWQETDA